MNDDKESTGNSRRSAEQAKAFGRGMMESAQQIWLAGLGAFSKAQKEGGKYFETLVEEGAQVQEKTRNYTQAQFEQAQRRAEPWVNGARKRTSDAFGKFEQMFDQRLARAMERMQVPTREDFDTLSARVEELERQVRAGKRAPRKSAGVKPPVSED
ncbi:MAG TPA: phasin family protein [Rhodanobacteraceae bacterium]|nr:phasin family protein [Rhodanobacteraceae bacterium]